MAAEAPSKAAQGLAGALESLLVWVKRDRAFRGLDIASVTASGRSFDVRLRGRKGGIRVDRTELVTLLRDLRGGKWSEDGRDLRYALHGEELDAYIAELAKKSVDDARALFVHVCSPYDLPEKDHALRHLFPKPLYATKKLDAAASGAALLKRALPHAASGDVVDRVAAAWIVQSTLSDVACDSKAKETFASLAPLVESLAKHKSPILRECGWLLEHEARRLSRAIKK